MRRPHLLSIGATAIGTAVSDGFTGEWRPVLEALAS
jgi:hypothetical protein